jgi:hypothetical protein
MGPFVTGTFSYGAFSDRTFCDGSFCDGSFCDETLCDGSFCDGSFCDGSFCDGPFVNCDGSFCESLVTMFHNSLKIAQIFFLCISKNKIIYSFVKFVDTKKGRTTNFFHPSLLLLFWIRDPGWVKIRIRDKHPGSATLVYHFNIRYLCCRA